MEGIAKQQNMASRPPSPWSSSSSSITSSTDSDYSTSSSLVVEVGRKIRETTFSLRSYEDETLEHFFIIIFREVKSELEELLTSRECMKVVLVFRACFVQLRLSDDNKLEEEENHSLIHSSAVKCIRNATDIEDYYGLHMSEVYDEVNLFISRGAHINYAECLIRVSDLDDYFE